MFVLARDGDSGGADIEANEDRTGVRGLPVVLCRSGGHCVLRGGVFSDIASQKRRLEQTEYIMRLVETRV